MRKLIKFILLDVGVEDLKIRSRGDNRCESAKGLGSLARSRYISSVIVGSGRTLFSQPDPPSWAP